MPIRRSIATDGEGDNQYRGNGINYFVKTDANTLYVFYLGGSNIFYRKSVDGGFTFHEPVQVNGVSASQLDVWYDKWSGLSSGYIHVAYAGSQAGTPYMYYRAVNTASSDALSTEKTIASFTSAADDGYITICRTRGGNVLYRLMIDAGVEGACYRIINANVPEGAVSSRTINEATAAGDRLILLPGFAADSNDAIGIFWDSSASEISRQLHDDSANTWAETSIATGMTAITSSTGNPNFAAAVDLTNSRIVLVAWSDTDLLNADLRCWTITESAITEKTNVVQNSTDDQGLCAISIDTENDDWYVFYGGKTDGSETFPTAVKVYYKVSTDNGTTWGSETLALPSNLSALNLRALYTSPSFTGSWVYYIMSGTATTNLSASIFFPANSSRKTQLILGI